MKSRTIDLAVSILLVSLNVNAHAQDKMTMMSVETLRTHIRCNGRLQYNCEQTPYSERVRQKVCSQRTIGAWEGTLNIHKTDDKHVRAVEICTAPQVSEILVCSNFYDANGILRNKSCYTKKNNHIPVRKCIWNFPRKQMDLSTATRQAESYITENFQCDSEMSISFRN